MAQTARPRQTAVAGTSGASADQREELKRTLARDTAIQGERAEEPAAAGAPAEAGSGRPARARSSRTR